MFKKVVCMMVAAVLLISAASALADDALVLNNQVIVDGARVYYAGSLDSASEGVYIMNADGSGVSQISNNFMTLLAADSGSLLAVSYNEGYTEYGLVVINTLGERTVVYEGYVDKAIVANGRFYWGVGSCAIDGSDVKKLIDDDEHSYNYYPLAVDGDYYYYLDWAANSGSIFNESSYPIGARLCRLNLTTNQSEQVSGYGTRYLGLDENYIYFARNSFWSYDADEDNTYETSVDEGVFRADKATLSTDKLVTFPEDESVYVSYEMMADGVIYGTYSRYSETEETYHIVRLAADGTQLSDLSLDNQVVTLHAVSDGRLFVSVCAIEATGDDYVQHDLLYSIDLETGTLALIPTPATDLFYFSESNPAIGVAGGRIYMLVFDNETYAISFKTCAVDGTDPITLARGYSMAMG